MRFHHDWDDQRLIRGYREALCAVLPSVYTDRYGASTTVPELLGQTLLEGMACGTPVICSRVGGLPEVVNDGVTGFVVPPSDAIALGERLARLQHDGDLVASLGSAGRAHIERRFTWSAVAERCLTAYRELTS